ncbi:MAG: glycosyltransferase family 2 protein [Candidatus Omnitrophota bacterium]|nr:glycosyltransferase family 2 protein [Candidatus Omnitrophota bacterium]
MIDSTQGRESSFSSPQPGVSVIVPIRNEQQYIERSISAVLRQDYPKEKIEVIVVDGMSDDGTRQIVQTIIDRESKNNMRLRIALLDNPSRIVPAALNIGLAYAQGAIMVRVDGHCEIPSAYIRRCVDLLAHTGADCVGGMQCAVSETTVGKAIALATSSPFGAGNAYFRYATKPGWVDTVYLGTYQRVIFERIGMFDEELVRNQDDEFNFRLIQAGGKIWFDPALSVRYYSRSTLARLWRQYFQYGFYKVRVIQKRNAIPSFRHIVPPLFVAALLASFLVGLVTRNNFLALIVGCPYLVLNVIFSAWVARRLPFTLFFLPFVFTIIHISYGLGFLTGLWRFRRNNKPHQTHTTGAL